MELVESALEAKQKPPASGDGEPEDPDDDDDPDEVPDPDEDPDDGAPKEGIAGMPAFLKAIAN